MLAAIFNKGDNKGGFISLEEIEKPKISRSDQILIEVKACGICGTDLKIMNGGHPANDRVILGHEFSGIVIAKGEGVDDIEIGDKVVVDPNEKCGYCTNCRKGLSNLCEYMATGTTFGIFQNGGFAKYCVVPRNTIFKLPEDINLEASALIEPLSCAVHCHNLADVKESDYVIIIGAGPMGMIIGSIVRKHPIKKLIYIELDEWRGKKALELGADFWINPNTQNVQDEILMNTDNNGAEVIIDAVGIAETFEMATSIWASGARLVCFGQDYRAEARIKPNEIVRFQRKILGSYIGYSQDFLDAIELISNRVIDVEKLITHRIPLKDLSKGFELMKEKKSIKIIVNL